MQRVRMCHSESSHSNNMKNKKFAEYMLLLRLKEPGSLTAKNNIIFSVNHLQFCGHFVLG